MKRTHEITPSKNTQWRYHVTYTHIHNLSLSSIWTNPNYSPPTAFLNPENGLWAKFTLSNLSNLGNLICEWGCLHCCFSSINSVTCLNPGNSQTLTTKAATATLQVSAIVCYSRHCVHTQSVKCPKSDLMMCWLCN